MINIKQQYASITQLSKMFGVSPDTIRNTLKECSKEIETVKIKSCIQYKIVDFRNAHIIEQSDYKDLLNNLLT